MYPGMTNTLTPRLLAHLGRSLVPGSALWAILIANEYLPKESKLRRALVRQGFQAEGSQLESIAPQALLKISRGGRFADLPPMQKEAICQISKLAPRQARCVTYTSRLSARAYRRRVLHGRARTGIAQRRHSSGAASVASYKRNALLQAMQESRSVTSTA